MKTSVVMRSNDRNLFGVNVRQETKTGFLSLSDLQACYEIARGINGWPEKIINDILASSANAERIYYILENQGLINTGFSAFMEYVEDQSLLKVLKSLGAYKTTGFSVDMGDIKTSEDLIVRLKAIWNRKWNKKI